MKILIISNGLGEDLIACNLIQAIKKKDSAAKINAIPLVGDGLHYQKIGITPSIKNKILPSGGFIRGLWDLIKDIKAGLIQNHLKQLKMINKLSEKCDITISVGDFFCFIIGAYKNKSKKFFLPTAKSDLFMTHNFFEKLILKKYSALIFPRDQLTTNSLKKEGLKTAFHGNPMMDNLKLTGIDFQLNKENQTLGLLPGSREEAYDNFSYFLDAILYINQKNTKINYIAAIPPTILYKKLQVLSEKKEWVFVENKLYHELKHPCGACITLSPHFPDIIKEINAAIGLAGTANEQVIYSGKKVICFEGFGPQSQRIRFEEQKKLLGEKLIFIEKRNLSIIRETILKVLDAEKKTSINNAPSNASKHIINDIYMFIKYNQ